MFVEINGEDVWIPSSQIHESSELRVCATPGKEGTLKVSIWFAIERGLL